MSLLNRLHQMQLPGNPTLLAVCLALLCLAVSARAETYDTWVHGPQILTPPPGPAPAINGPEVYGVRPGSPVIYRIPTTGRRPIRFTAKDLPATLRIDQAKGVVTGHAPASAGRHVVTLLAENDHGKDERKLTFVVGDKFALTPPMGWNHWYTHYHFITGNSIHDIHVRQLFSGAEMAGIRFHGPIDTTINGNHIYRTCRRMWLDWMTQGTRISNHLCHDNAANPTPGPFEAPGTGTLTMKVWLLESTREMK